jgi:hypothetical protein
MLEFPSTNTMGTKIIFFLVYLSSFHYDLLAGGDAVDDDGVDLCPTFKAFEPIKEEGWDILAYEIK